MKLTQYGSNQTLVSFGNNEVLFSYSTPVAGFISGIGYVKTSQKWSVTTSRHINKYVGSNNVTEKDQTFFDDLFDDVEIKL
jgi:hypothetical protein